MPHNQIAFLLALFLSVTIGAADRPRPNVVLVMVDDLGFSDLGCYGGEIATPNLDKLASEGLRYTQFYNTAKCEVSRRSLLTGLWHVDYQAEEKRNFVTVADVMKQAGYTTLMTGKWHIDGEPLQRGFERYFGHLSGSTDYFLGDKTFKLDDKPFEVPKENFYTTDANTDYAIQFVEEASAKDKPFFLYIAYNAPHYPLQAPKADIEKYIGKYKVGWDEIRKQRYQRQVELGLIDKRSALSPRPDDVRPWSDLSEAEKTDQDLKMATYAAMVDRLDRNIGRLFEKLKALKVDDNTVFMFLSDNGGCPFDRGKKLEHPPWEGGGHWTYDKHWASASNTPLRLYKQNSHEGGIASPFIVRWPAKIHDGGKWVHDPSHLVDVMPTCMELSGGKYPDKFGNVQIPQYAGTSLVKTWRGESLGERTLYWSYGNNKAVRVGDWKLVAAAGKPWELYNLSGDRTELHDLVASESSRVEKMNELWQAWHNRDVQGDESEKGEEQEKGRKGQGAKKKKPSE